MSQLRTVEPDFFAQTDGFGQGEYAFPEFCNDGRVMMEIMDIQQGYSQEPLPCHNLHASNRKRKDPPLEDHLMEDTKQIRFNSQDDSKRNVRQNHSEIEKRRRDKMNTYITELSAMIPTCVAMNRKMDKLTVLRLAVQHLKTIRGSLDSYTEACNKPPMLSDSELNNLIIPRANGFTFVVDSARTRILYVSEGVQDVLNFSHHDLIGQSLFDILHPKDIDKVKEQLSNYDATPRERLIDSKTLLPLKGGEVPQSISRLHPGARRVFLCRMKCKPSLLPIIKQEDDITPDPLLNQKYGESSSNPGKRKKCGNPDKKYVSIQCTGYIKSWPLTKIGLEAESDFDSDSDACNMNCLVAVGRIQPTYQATIKDCAERGRTTAEDVLFVSRHGIDGNFLYVDQRVTLMLGYMPQELVGTSFYEHVQYEDIPVIADCHRNTLREKGEVVTPFYRFRAKNGKFVKLESRWKQFRNPWTREIEYIVCKNSLLITQQVEEGDGGSFSDTGDMDFFSSGNSTEGGEVTVGKDIQRVISSHAEAAKIGRHIADEIVERWRSDSSASNSPVSSLLQAGSPTEPKPTTSNSGNHSASIIQPDREEENKLLQEALVQVEHERNKLSGVIVSRNSSVRSGGTGGAGSRPTSAHSEQGEGGQSSNQSLSDSSEGGNDEAATAVLMSLLEAEGGLGGPFDYGNLPWPLP